ncbi:ABC transporter ATP-binding protein, partial [Lactobacillus paragasseri]
MSFQKLIKTNLLLFIVIIVLEILFAAGSATSSYI